MSEQTPDEGQPIDAPAVEEESAAPATPAESEGGGYDYEVVEDEEEGAGGGFKLPMPAMLAIAAIVPAVIVGVAVWFIASGGSGGGGDERVTTNVTNVVNAFSQGQTGSVTRRFEGQLAPGFPKDVPLYPGAKLISSELQISGSDADYLVVYDTGDSRQKVADYFSGKLDADPWEVDASQDDRESSLRQFSNVSDANVRGLVLAAESKQDDVTTVIVSVQVTSGAAAAGSEQFDPGDSRPLPAGFPTSVPAYPGATVMSTTYQKCTRDQALGGACTAGSLTFRVSMVTQDAASKVLDYYRTQLATNQLTVTDGDASQSTLAGATAIDFTDAGQTVQGSITVGALAEDAKYAQVDISAATQPSAQAPAGAPTEGATPAPTEAAAPTP